MLYTALVYANLLFLLSIVVSLIIHVCNTKNQEIFEGFLVLSAFAAMVVLLFFVNTIFSYHYVNNMLIWGYSYWAMVFLLFETLCIGLFSGSLGMYMAIKTGAKFDDK